MMDAERIRQRVRIEDVITRSGVELTGKGRYLRSKRHDSLVVDTVAQMMNWNSRGIHGDVFTWLEETQHLTFAEAARQLEAGCVGISILPIAPARPVEPAPELRQDLHLQYYRNLDDPARQWWHGQGISDEGIARFFLGVCDFHPLYRQTTYTIPVIEQGKLVNVRHRLSAPSVPQDKYRPECAGLGAHLFNGDILTPELAGVVIVAGEKKAIVLWQSSIPAISSTAGCGHWPDEWTTRLQFCRKVYLAFDPGETAAAWKVAEKIGERAFVVNLSDKPDDYILAAGADAFRQQLREAEPYADRNYWHRQLPGRALWGKELE